MARILIGEDDALTALDLEDILREAGHDIVAVIARVSDGHQHVGAVDIAVLDVELADGQCFELARSLLDAGTSIVFVSGNRDEDLPPDLPALFQEKPFQPAALLATIDALILRRDESAG